jgi:hypothetical protein
MLPPEAAKSTSKRSLNRRCAAPPISAAAGSRRPLKVRPKGGPPKVRPKRVQSPPVLLPKGALLVAKPATLFYAGGRKKVAGMEPKRSCICRLGEAATRRKAGHLYYAAAGSRRPAKSTSKKRPEPARITSKWSPTCHKAGHPILCRRPQKGCWNGTQKKLHSSPW